MNRYYKILKIEAKELTAQSDNYPVNGIIPFGPPFQSKKDARAWLSENAETGMEYFFNKFYSKSVPENLIEEVKKPKVKKPKIQQ